MPAPALSENAEETDLMQLFGTLWRGKWVIMFYALLIAVVGGYYAYKVAVPKYAATTMLALQLRTENIVDLESVISGASSDSAALNTELEVIRSRGLIEQLVTRLNLLEDPEFNVVLQPEPEFSLDIGIVKIRALVGLPAPEMPPHSQEAILNETVRAVRDVISATNLRATYIFNIGVKTESAQKSAMMANTLAGLYISDQIAVKFQATENAVNWLSERVTSLENELRVKERAIKDLRARSEHISPEALDVLSRQGKDVRDRLTETQAAMGAAQVRLANMQELQEAGDVLAMATGSNDLALNRLFRDMDTGGEKARRLFSARYDLLLARVQSNVDRVKHQVAALEASSVRSKERIEKQSAALIQLEQMERETEATSVLYETFLTRLKETTVQRGLQQADSRVLSAATPPQRSVEPRKTLILAMSIILGCLLGIGIVMLRQLVHNGFRTAEELETATGMAVLGQIPRLPIRKRNALIKYLKDKPTSAASEAIRNLRTSVLLSDIDNPPQVIMSTSSIPGEGKTTQAIALAQNLSGLGKRVLLIEGDIRRQTFTEYFDFSPKNGILTALSDDVALKDVVSWDERMGCDVLMGEKSNVNAADIFSSDRFLEFLKKVRSAYDYIVIDTPPVLVVPDARVIGQYVDAIIFSIKWDSTSKSQVTEALRQFSSVNLRVTGLVLGQIDERGMKRYGYGAYSRYGKGYYES
ncbi:MAG: polysaccharide biosynthesis tyrosine autokinase [Rhodobacteraceae bacterium]|nr:polysaccharide biosynthesis tyrosine autokinase [Paracoccaceae bacterium]